MFAFVSYIQAHTCTTYSEITLRFVLCLFQSSSILSFNFITTDYHFTFFNSIHWTFVEFSFNFFIGLKLLFVEQFFNWMHGQTIPKLTRKSLKRISAEIVGGEGPQSCSIMQRKKSLENSIKFWLMYAIYRFIIILLYSNIEIVQANTIYRWIDCVYRTCGSFRCRCVRFHCVRAHGLLWWRVWYVVTIIDNQKLT